MGTYAGCSSCGWEWMIGASSCISRTYLTHIFIIITICVCSALLYSELRNKEAMLQHLIGTGENEDEESTVSAQCSTSRSCIRSRERMCVWCGLEFPRRHALPVVVLVFMYRPTAGIDHGEEEADECYSGVQRRKVVHDENSRTCS